MTIIPCVLCKGVLTVFNIIIFKNIKGLSNKNIMNPFLPKCSKFKIKDNVCMGNVVLSSIYQACKVYFAYDRPWWRTDGNGDVFRKADNIKQIITDLPLRVVIHLWHSSS